MIRREPSLLDLVSLAGGAVDDHVIRVVESKGFGGLRVRHGYVFQRLLDGPASITALAEALEVSQQAMSKTIAELVALGYVEASVDPADGRRRVLALTERGIASVESARRARASLERQLAAAVGEDRLAATRETLADLLHELGLAGRIDERTVPMPPP